MSTTHPDSAARRVRRPKPAVGRPVLFSLLLAVAALGVLILLVAGPSITLELAVGGAAALICLVVLTWVVAGPRL